MYFSDNFSEITDIYYIHIYCANANKKDCQKYYNYLKIIVVAVALGDTIGLLKGHIPVIQSLL